MGEAKKAISEAEGGLDAFKHWHDPHSGRFAPKGFSSPVHSKAAAHLAPGDVLADGRTVARNHKITPPKGPFIPEGGGKEGLKHKIDFTNGTSETHHFNTHLNVQGPPGPTVAGEPVKIPPPKPSRMGRKISSDSAVKGWETRKHGGVNGDLEHHTKTYSKTTMGHITRASGEKNYSVKVTHSGQKLLGPPGSKTRSVVKDNITSLDKAHDVADQLAQSLDRHSPGPTVGGKPVTIPPARRSRLFGRSPKVIGGRGGTAFH